MKSGWRTSEFWLTVGASVVALLVLLGFVTTEEGELIKSQLVQVVALGGPFLVALSSLVVYIWGRVQIKRDQGKTNVTELSAVLESDGEGIEWVHGSTEK